MKLLIDIPEHIYEHAKETTEDSRDEFDAMRAIANGTQQESSSEIPNTCGDAISRADARHLIAETNRNALGYISTKVFKILYDGIDKLPSVTPQQRMGRWITSHIPESMLCECSECGFTCGAYSFNYCPNCGAKMEVEE